MARPPDRTVELPALGNRISDLARHLAVDYGCRVLLLEVFEADLRLNLAERTIAPAWRPARVLTARQEVVAHFVGILARSATSGDKSQSQNRSKQSQSHLPTISPTDTQVAVESAVSISGAGLTVGHVVVEATRALERYSHGLQLGRCRAGAQERQSGAPPTEARALRQISGIRPTILEAAHKKNECKGNLVIVAMSLEVPAVTAVALAIAIVIL